VGVSLFFALSGYLITSLLSREAARSGTVDLPRFYLRRAVRLFPSAWLLVLVVAALKLRGAVTEDSWGGIAASFCYFRNVMGRGVTLEHLWSLSLEEQFYLVWPVLFLVAPRRKLEVAIALSVAVALARFTLGNPVSDPGALYMRPWFRFDACVVGCALALLERRRPALFSAPSGVARVLLHPALLAAALAAAVYAGGLRVSALELTAQTWLSALLLFRCLTPGADGYRALLRSAPLRALGRVSYSLYLWQQLFLVAREPAWPFLRRPGVDVAAATMVSLLAYFLVERPCFALKDRIGARARAVPRVASG
jgi:peptidoglycan/LPS O-acetylase OafA/YrhL